MAQAIHQIDTDHGELTVGHARFRHIGQDPQATHACVKQAVTDSDTVSVQPETKIPLPRPTPTTAARSSSPLADPAWEQVLHRPVRPTLPPFNPLLDTALAARCGPGTATNHARLARPPPSWRSW